MAIDEIVRRLERIAPYGMHYPGEPLFVLSLDDGIALKEAIELLKKQEAVKQETYENGFHDGYRQAMREANPCADCQEWDCDECKHRKNGELD